MRKKISFFVLLILFPFLVFPQFGEREGEPDVREMSTRERFFVGGFLGLQLGTFTAVGVNAHGGYRFTNRLSAGVGGSYQYTNDRWLGESFSSHTYGGSVFARFRVFDQAFIHAEQEWLSLLSRLELINPENRPRISEQNLLLGPGYAIRLSPRARINILLLYNFNENSQVYFNNPFFRVGLDISL